MSLEAGIIKLSLPAYIKILESKKWNRTQIGKSIGVTPFQVYLYGKGTTKQPKAEICMNIFNGTKIEGKSVLLDLYESYEELENHYNREVNSVF